MMVEIANRIDPDEVTLNEPPHPDLHCLKHFFEVWRMSTLFSPVLISLTTKKHTTKFKSVNFQKM